jgi:DNA polymerase-3 subunit gamma/tau
MSYQVLARKWRPHTFEDLVGQQHVVRALVNGLDQNRVHHAFLLTGTRGVGKTTIARILAKCLNCEQGVSSTPCGECGSCVDVDEGRFVDMLEIDAASKTKVDDTRDLLETVQYTPTRGRYKVYIIDEVHMLSGHSFNALLKTLEEPPPHVKFILATTDPQKLPITILSRCLRFSLTRLLPDQISAHLARILATESIDAEESAVMRIARAADGSMRDGLSLLDQAIAFGGGSLKDADVASMLGSIDHEHIAAILAAISRSDASALMTIVEELVSRSRNLASVLDELAEAMHRIALIHAAPEFSDQERSDWESLKACAALVSPEDAQLYYQIAITGRRDLGLAPDPRTGLEMTLLRLLAFRPAEAGSETKAPPERAVAAPAADKGPAAKPAGTAATRAADTSGMTPAEAARAAFNAMLAPSGPGAGKPAETAVETEPATVAGPQRGLESGPETSLAQEMPTPAGPQHPQDNESGSTPALELDPLPGAAVEKTERGRLPDWSRMQAGLELAGAAREFARNLQLESVIGKRWRYLVPETLRDLGTESVLRDLRSALSDRLGEDVTLEVHTANGPVQSVAAEIERAEINKMTDAERSIDEDSTVQELKNRFGAKIIPDSIQPLQ